MNDRSYPRIIGPRKTHEPFPKMIVQSINCPETICSIEISVSFYRQAHYKLNFIATSSENPISSRISSSSGQTKTFAKNSNPLRLESSIKQTTTPAENSNPSRLKSSSGQIRPSDLRYARYKILSSRTQSKTYAENPLFSTLQPARGQSKFAISSTLQSSSGRSKTYAEGFNYRRTVSPPKLTTLSESSTSSRTSSPPRQTKTSLEKCISWIFQSSPEERSNGLRTPSPAN